MAVDPNVDSDGELSVNKQHAAPTPATPAAAQPPPTAPQPPPQQPAQVCYHGDRLTRCLLEE